jgi:hypothetical protein
MSGRFERARIAANSFQRPKADRSDPNSWVANPIARCPRGSGIAILFQWWKNVFDQAATEAMQALRFKHDACQPPKVSIQKFII